MNERVQSPREQLNGSGPWDNIFDEPENVASQVMVHSGPHTRALPLAQMTIAEIRARFQDVLDIDQQSRAVLDGLDVNNDTVVRQGQVLMFTHRAGEKGRCARSTSFPSGSQIRKKPAARSGKTQAPIRPSISRSRFMGRDVRHFQARLPRWRPALHKGFTSSPVLVQRHES